MSEFSYQLDNSGHRGTRAIQRLVEYAPASGGLALWMQHRNVAQVPASVLFFDTDNRIKSKPWIIGNDGSTIFYGPHFLNFSLEEQTGMVAHQVLHVALRHVDRESQLRQRYGQIDAELFAVCADAIVNASLSHLSWLKLPKGSVHLDQLLSQVLDIDEPLDVSLHQWDTESLYRAIDDRSSSGSGRQGQGQGQDDARSAEAASAASGKGNQSLQKSSGQDSSDSASIQQLQQQIRQQNSTPAQAHNSNSVSIESNFKDGPRANAARQLAATMIRDLVPSPSSSPETRAELAQQWSERLLTAHTADAQQSFMRQLLADNKPSTTPWEQLLRTRLQRALSLQRDITWSRPTRSWLANRGKTSSGHRLPWQPGSSYSRTAPRLCILVDVSGSVNNELMQRFANEIDRIVRTFNTEARLIIGDDCVREQHRLKCGVNELRDIQFNGGGGTDFVPLINAANEFKPDIGVFLTDLEGPAGDPPPWPIIWAVPIEANAQALPYGQRIFLD